MSASFTKITSMGSQYSAASGTPRVPNTTPVTGSLASDDDETMPMDFVAVSGILAPIQEQLNEFADEAELPSAPINTPVSLSPTSSITSASQGRVRSLGSIRNRLEQLKIQGRKHARRDTDGTYSDLSLEPSVAEDEDFEMASISEVLSDPGRDRTGHGQHGLSLRPLDSISGDGSVLIALGSPTVNPRIEEYLSFTSKDLPTKATADCTPYTSYANNSVHAAVDAMGSCTSLKSDGVTEKSNWAEEVEDSVDHACMRLEQLAKDEHVADPSKTAEEYYVARLERLLGSRKRIVPVMVKKAKNIHG